jgi:hypothetical protein
LQPALVSHCSAKKNVFGKSDALKRGVDEKIRSGKKWLFRIPYPQHYAQPVTSSNTQPTLPTQPKIP